MSKAWFTKNVNDYMLMPELNALESQGFSIFKIIYLGNNNNYSYMDIYNIIAFKEVDSN